MRIIGKVVKNMNIEMVLAMAVKLALTVMWDVERWGCSPAYNRVTSLPLPSITKFSVLLMNN